MYPVSGECCIVLMSFLLIILVEIGTHCVYGYGAVWGLFQGVIDSKKQFKTLIFSHYTLWLQVKINFLKLTKKVEFFMDS